MKLKKIYRSKNLPTWARAIYKDRRYPLYLYEENDDKKSGRISPLTLGTIINLIRR